MKLSKRFKNSVYALLSFVALFLIFWIWSGGSILKIVKADWTKGMPNTNIDATSTNHWAWNDVIGWIDFYNTERVMVQSREIKGYASSSVGEISLNCDSSGNFGEVSYCGPPYNAPFKVKNDGGGKLSGWAWNDLVGWISFCGTSNAASSSDNCLYSEYTYGTALKWNDIDNNPPCGYSDDQPPSDFYGYAWNDIAGWISFNTSTPICPLPSSDSNYEAGYKVRSGWYATSTYGDVYSSIFDTGIVGGAQFNSVGFNADLPTGTAILLQFATACSSALESPPNCTSWKFVGGLDGTDSSFYRLDSHPDNKHSRQQYYINLSNQFHNNSQYFRYRLRLKSNNIQNLSPTIWDVTVNWSP